MHMICNQFNETFNLYIFFMKESYYRYYLNYNYCNLRIKNDILLFQVINKYSNIDLFHSFMHSIDLILQRKN